MAKLETLSLQRREDAAYAGSQITILNASGKWTRTSLFCHGLPGGSNGDLLVVG
jgi:hypothetical protein